MRSELRKEMIRVLESSSNAGLEGLILASGRHSALALEAIGLLEEVGALWEVEKNRYLITIRGYDYIQELKAPKRYWVRQNWFPVAVLVVSSLVTVAASLIVVLLG